MIGEMLYPSNVSLLDTGLLLTTMLTVLFLILSYELLTNNRRSRRRRFLELSRKLPGPMPLPFIGNALKFACKSKEMLNRLETIIISHSTKEVPMKLWMGSELYVVVTAPGDIEKVLNSQQACYKGRVYRFLHPFIGNGLISGDGNMWRRHRKLLTYTMTQKVLHGFVNIFDRHSRKLMDKLESQADGGYDFDIFPYIEACTIDIVCEAVMGRLDVNAQDNADQEIIHYTAKMYKIIFERMTKVWLQSDWIFNQTRYYTEQQRGREVIQNFVHTCVSAKRNDQNYTPLLSSNQKSILEHLLESLKSSSNSLTDSELQDEIYTVYIASQDTIALISSFATLMLGMHHEAQEKARKEIEEIFQGEDEPLTSESLSQLKYLEAVIKETIRLFPIAPFLIRHLRGELPLENCILPEDCQVLIAAYVTHRSVDYWREPKKFLPERFSAEESSTRHPYAFIPFSGGPMSCIGQKFAMTCLKVILANLLRCYRIDTTWQMSDLLLNADISVRSINGYRVSLKPHEKAA
ncbi:cytochrome P450 4C1 [Cephus cinctus]|uniref:Cytochrome P450 4C1 n=1 Tax=Cephus cinctus TaxID=211228 RepID=A0AAJ7C417_CEPCN|nr:cytochrome P450 4C1 [Cephus cinctus]XP_015600594.1 cytochrome P450 4C1 [Cephus cinctus]